MEKFVVGAIEISDAFQGVMADFILGGNLRPLFAQMRKFNGPPSTLGKIGCQLAYVIEPENALIIADVMPEKISLRIGVMPDLENFPIFGKISDECFEIGRSR